jgi:hypothetical protein
MIRLDAIKHRLDANETLFLARELESIEAKLYEYKVRELKYRKLIPVSNQDSPGVETITYRMLTKYGMAKIIANYADDLPRVGAIMQEHSQKVKTIGTSFGYNTQEIRAAAYANKSLDTIYADAARRAVREEESQLAWTGNATYGIIGFLNNANIPVQAVVAGVGGTTWVFKTPDEIIADIATGTGQIRTQSNGIHVANTMLLPIPQYNIIATTPRSTNSDMTILEFITKPGNAFGLTTIDWLSTELTNAFVGGTKDGMVLYENDEEVLQNRIPLEMITHPIQEKNLEYIVPVEARNGGVVIRYPLACLFMTGI